MKITKVEPPNWWVGMKWNDLQLMVYGSDLVNVKVKSISDNLRVSKIHQPENSNYLFVDLHVSEIAQPGFYELIFISDREEIFFKYELKEREADDGQRGFDNKDVIYLIVPDRFANGDTSNDKIDGLKDQYKPDNHLGRHGGDLKGIIDHLDYLDDLGITAIWINPLVENDTHISYHGYSATDFYNIDPRFGNNELYKLLVEEAHKRGLKIILDHVTNHISIDHPWMSDLPMSDWIHGSVENHLNARHDKMVLSDLHAAAQTKKYLTEGWFVDSMPDLNQNSPFLANYIIQNTIWWIEYSGLDGIREDTYPYADQKFLSEWSNSILDEYPELNIVGEVWTGEPAFLAYYQTGSFLPRDFDTNLPSVTDFGIRDQYYGYLKGQRKLYDIYQTFSMDYLYPNPDMLVTFIDNHDVARVMWAADGNVEKAKLVLTMLLTTRGIPQILYATEIGMVGAEEHGILRSDFPGGFPGCERDAFTKEGRTDYENDIYDYLKNLLHHRKKYQTLASGKMIHLPPSEGVYIYFKISETEKMMIVINEGVNEAKINPNDIVEAIGAYTQAIDINNLQSKFNYEQSISCDGKSASIFLLK